MNKIKIGLSVVILVHVAIAQEQVDSVVTPINNETSEIKASIETIDQRLKVQERLFELTLEEQSAAKAKNSKSDASAKGFRIESSKGEYYLKIGGFIQPTAQYFFNDSAKKLTNNYSLRRVRSDFQLGLGEGFTARLQSEYSPASTPSLVDAYIDWKLFPFLTIRAGRFNPPIGLEYTFSTVKYAFLDLSPVSAFLPNRDIGLQFQGSDGDEILQYSFGILNGTVDGGRSEKDFEDEKEFVGRAYITPFVGSSPSAISGFGVGLGGSAGKQFSAPASYSSIGRNKIFSYRSADTLNGWQFRIVPQAAYYYNSFGLLGEYAISKVLVRDSLFINTGKLEHRAWQVLANYVVTGEDAGLKGVTPRKSINVASDSGSGAIEIVARVSGVNFDKKSFNTFADSTKSVEAVISYSAGLNWYATRNLRLSTEYSWSQFEGGARGSSDRASEHVLNTTATLQF